MGKRLSFLDFPSDLPRYLDSKSIWNNKEIIKTLGNSNQQRRVASCKRKRTYDMVNPQEDPDLVSGKFQPKRNKS